MDEATRERIEALMPEAYIVSAFSGDGVDELRMQVESMLPAPNVHVEALLPYAAGSLVSRVREYGKATGTAFVSVHILCEANHFFSTCKSCYNASKRHAVWIE